MNKKAIWLIIGLMSAALLGIVWLQMNWIRDSIQTIEQKFEKDVYEALQGVVGRLEKYEIMRVSNMTQGYEQQILSAQYNDEQGGAIQLSFREIIKTNYRIPEDKLADLFDPKCFCDDCKKERAQTRELINHINKEETILGLLQKQQLVPLAQRIDLQLLHKTLKKELENQGIKGEYNYGVYSTRESSFVIKDNNYLFVEGPKVTNLSGYDHLSQTPYRVNLFPDDNIPPGYLMVYFPSKTSQIWASVLPNLSASLVFLSIILFSFVYTIQVIFRQKKLSEMKTDFINNMTHEFKTPIATISLATDSITSPMVLSNTDKVKRFADIIRQENKRMLSQVEKVLQMALIDKQEFKLKLSPVNLHEVINQAVSHSNLQVEKKGGKVTADLQATHPTIEGDLTHLSNIIHNLLDNANKYSPNQPAISVQTRNVPNGVQVTVTDNGIGMSKEARKHIFDKFYRVHTGNLHDVKGFGLGLSYVKAMMTAHKGQIDVKSELGKGSSFILLFPFRLES